MGNQGLLVANEIHAQRVWELAENLERWGVHNVTITNETPERLAAHFGPFFDRVLVDAPCSGEGMFRKSGAARRDWSPELVQSCALRQGAILNHAARLVRPGGRMVYSTCTFNPQENEAVVECFLDRHPDFELLEAAPAPGFEPGRPDWLAGRKVRPELQRAVRLWPHRSPGEGHFIALLQKVDSVDILAGKARQKFNRVESGVSKIFTEFCQANLHVGFDPARLSQAGSYLYQLPEGLPDRRYSLGGLKVIHPGWWLGTFKKNRFVPSHALALGLRATDACRALNLPAEGMEVRSYLHGETLPWLGEDGWLLVTVDGYPLGWGKRAQGVIKNYYPRGLRRY
jgi:NOL1/NOP2/fmu family ribosome biogenesis protein